MEIKISENKKPLVEDNFIRTQYVNTTDERENLQVNQNNKKSFIINNLFVKKSALLFKKFNQDQNNTLSSSADNEEVHFDETINNLNFVFLTSFNVLVFFYISLFILMKRERLLFACLGLVFTVLGCCKILKFKNILLNCVFYFISLFIQFYQISCIDLPDFPISFDFYNLPTQLFILNLCLLFMKFINLYVYTKKMCESQSKKHPSIFYFILLFLIYVLFLLLGNKGNFFTAYTKYIFLTYSIILLWFFITIIDFMPKEIKIHCFITIFVYLLNDFVNPITYLVCIDYFQRVLDNITVVG